MNGEVKRCDSEEVTAPRLVHMKKGDQGYGFNLHGEKGVQGQTISAVDKGSPAELGGLREGDRVIEVNGSNVENMKHGEVVGKIKQKPGETRLLVIDSITDKYLRENGRPITEDMANLSTVYQTPEPTPEPTPTEPEPVETPPSEPEPEVVVVDAPTPSPAESAPPVESAPEPVQPPSEPESPPETEQEGSPKDAIDEINNVLEQEEQKPAEPEVNEAEDLKKAMAAARLAGKPKRKEVKGERKPWQDMKKQFDSM